MEAPFAIKMENEEVFKRDNNGNALLDETTDHVAIWEVGIRQLKTYLQKLVIIYNFLDHGRIDEYRFDQIHWLRKF